MKSSKTYFRVAAVSVVILVLTAKESRGVARSMRQAGIDVSTASLPEGSEIVRALVIDPSNPRTIYAGTYAGVIKSTDGGGSWSAVNDGLGNRAVVSLAIDPSNTNIIYGGTVSGIFKSTNGGDAWRAVNSVPRFARSLALIEPSAP